MQRRHRSPRRDAAEDDAAAGRQRLQDEPGAHAGVEPLAVHDDAARDRALRPTAAAAQRRRSSAAAPASSAARRRVGRRVGRARARGRPRCSSASSENGFSMKSKAPSLVAAHRGLDVAVARDHDDRASPGPASRMRRTSSMPSTSGIQMSSDHQRGAARSRAARARRGRPRPRAPEALVGQHAAQRAADLRLVVDHQDRLGHRASSSRHAPCAAVQDDLLERPLAPGTR